MTWMPPPPEEQVLFLRNIQRLLAEGQFTASYKFALLLALADLCVLQGDDSGAPLELSIRDIAEKYVELYWQQCRPFESGGRDTGIILAQNTGKQAAVISKILAAQHACSGSLFRLRQTAPDLWRALVADIRQVVSGATRRLLPWGRRLRTYRSPWTTIPSTAVATGLWPAPGCWTMRFRCSPTRSACRVRGCCWPCRCWSATADRRVRQGIRFPASVVLRSADDRGDVVCRGAAETALQFDPDWEIAHFNKGLTLRAMGRTPEAVEAAYIRQTAQVLYCRTVAVSHHASGPLNLKAAEHDAAACPVAEWLLARRYRRESPG